MRENYRGITLLSVLGKLFTRVLNNRLVTWAEEFRIYIEAQGGFRPGRGTVDNIYVLDCIVNSFLSEGKSLYSAFIDFSKAFDYVVRDNLWFKLIKVGITGKMLDMIRGIYNKVKTRVFHQGLKSDEFECSLGVRQGDCLSPFLFAMYINDLESSLLHSGCGIDVGQLHLPLLLYADDVILLSDSKEQLQRSLDVLYNYSNKWKLKINTTKSKVMVFKKGRQRVNEQWFYGDQEIMKTKSISYLGVMLTQGGTTNITQKTLSDQALKATFDLQKKLTKFEYIRPPEIKSLFYKLVVPILNYASEVWGFNPGADVERVHLKFLKNLLGVKRSTPNDFIYGEFGVMPLSETRKIQIVKYWAKTITSQKPLLVMNCYNVMYNNCLQSERTVNWASRVRDLLSCLGLREYWLSHDIGDINGFMSLVNQRVNDQYQQNWRSKLDDSTKARFYREIRPRFSCQTYLSQIHSVHHLKSFARLITSSHRLRVETGRWERPPIAYENRKCHICHVEIEDEFHFLFKCPLYNDDRTKLVPRYYRVNPSMFKLIELMNSQNTRLINRIAKFVYNSFKIRTSFFSQ